MDLTGTIEPKSDQLNSDDLMTGPRTFTVERVNAGSVEQPVEIHLVGYPGRPFKPSKTVRRILITAWGTESTAYVGRRMTLYRDPTVRFGKDEVGGIRVSHLSDIDAPVQLALTVTRGKRAPFRVDPLPPVPSIAEFEQRITDAADLLTLKAIAAELKTVNLGEHKARLQAAWAARETALKTAPVDDEDYGDLLDAASGEGE
jgi:hypothetical protein